MKGKDSNTPWSRSMIKSCWDIKTKSRRCQNLGQKFEVLEFLTGLGLAGSGACGLLYFGLRGLGLKYKPARQTARYASSGVILPS